MTTASCLRAQISPTTLFFIQGSGQTLHGAMCWGDGFITDKTLIAQTGMSDPNPFFVSLLQKPYLNNVVISPHYYPPSISHAIDQLRAHFFLLSCFTPGLCSALASSKGRSSHLHAKLSFAS